MKLLILLLTLTGCGTQSNGTDSANPPCTVTAVEGGYELDCPNGSRAFVAVSSPTPKATPSPTPKPKKRDEHES